MAPIRRYLRITKYSVLELRIYLDNPALSETWLLRRNDPALPRIIEAIRPYFLPKLREEKERVRKGGKKKKGSIKSDVKQDDFEVSFFLIHQSSPHSILTKSKDFTEKPRLKSNSSKLTSWLTTGGGTSEAPIDVEDAAKEPGDDQSPVVIIREEEDEDDINIADIPELPAAEQNEEEDDDDAFLINDSDSDSAFEPVHSNRRAQHKPPDAEAAEAASASASDNKKKLALATNYEGFSIYGHILCLIIKRVGPGTPATSKANSSQQMMENWVSTQAQRDEEGLPVEE